MGSPGFGIYNIENLWPGRWSGSRLSNRQPTGGAIDYEALLGPAPPPSPKPNIGAPAAVTPPSPTELAALMGIKPAESPVDDAAAGRGPTGNLAHILRGYGLHGSLNYSAEGPEVSDDMTRFGRGRVVKGTTVTGVGDPAEAAAASQRRRELDFEADRRRMITEAGEIPGQVEAEMRSDPRTFAAVQGAVAQRTNAAAQAANALGRPQPLAGQGPSIEAVGREMAGPSAAAAFIQDAIAKAKASLETQPIDQQVAAGESAFERGQWYSPEETAFRRAKAEEGARMRLEPGPVSELEKMLFGRQLDLAQAENQRFGYSAPSSAGIEGAPTSEGRGARPAGGRVATRQEVVQALQSAGLPPTPNNIARYVAELKAKGYQVQ